MDIKKIRYFITIVDQGGYSAAGRKLFVSQPNLSKSIRSLEADLGGKLLRQIGGKMELTPKGKKLYMLGSHLVEEYDALCDSLRDDQFTLSGSISIGIPPIIGTCVLPDLLYRFQQKYPKISLKICQSPANTIQKMVNDGSIEIGFVILPVLPDTFDAILVASDTNTLIVHPSHPLAGESSVTYTQLRNEKFILLDNEYILTASIISACREYGLRAGDPGGNIQLGLCRPIGKDQHGRVHHPAPYLRPVSRFRHCSGRHRPPLAKLECCNDRQKRALSQSTRAQFYFFCQRVYFKRLADLAKNTRLERVSLQ